MGNPTVTPISEIRHRGGYMVWDPSDGGLTNEQVTIKSGEPVATAGTVLGKVITGQTVAVAAKSGGNTGNGTFVIDATTPLLERAQLGKYTLRCITAAANNGTFRLEDPTGVVLGDIVMAAGAGAVAEQIKGALADGATDFVVGDGFDITVSAESVKYVVFDPTRADGGEIAAGLLWSERKDATTADKKATATTHGPCKVNAAELVWGANVTTTAQKTLALSQLAALGILNV